MSTTTQASATYNQTPLTKIYKRQTSKSGRNISPYQKISVSELRTMYDAHVLNGQRDFKEVFTKNDSSKKDNRSLVIEEVIIPRMIRPDVDAPTVGQNFYMRNYPNGNDQRYLCVDGDALKMTATTTENKCKFLVTAYPQLQGTLVAVTFQHIDSSKYISATTTAGVALIDSTATQIFQSTDSKLFYRHFDSDLDHYYFESVTNEGYYLAYDRTNDDVYLLQLSTSDIQNKTGNALDVFFKHVSP